MITVTLASVDKIQGCKNSFFTPDNTLDTSLSVDMVVSTSVAVIDQRPAELFCLCRVGKLRYQQNTSIEGKTSIYRLS